MRTWRTRWATVLSFVLLSAAPGQEVPRYRLVNPVAGYVVDLPIDYELGTGGLRQSTMGINVSNYGSPSTPLYGFFHCKPAPQEGAGSVAQYVGLAYPRAQVKVGQGPSANEWQVQAAGPSDMLGPLVAQWFVRPGQGINYGVSVVAKLPVYENFRNEIAGTLASFRQIDRVTSRLAKEQRERAYKVTMPEQWSFQGRIHRSRVCPGWAVWQAQSADGLVGCFENPPGQATIHPLSIRDIAGTYTLQGIQKEVQTVQSLRVDRITMLPRGAAAILDFWKSFGGTSLTQPSAEKAMVDYLGSVNGVAVRMRVFTTSYYVPFYGRPDLPGSFNWFIWGLWAPVEGFDVASGLAHSVHGSLEYDRKWLAEQRRVVGGVLDERRKAQDKWNDQWMKHIAGNQDGGPDPDHPGDNIPDGPEGQDCYRNDDTGEYKYSPSKLPEPPWRLVKPQKPG